MRSNVKWLIAGAIAGAVAQYLWLQGIPSLEAQAAGVVVSTVASTALAALLTDRLTAGLNRSWLVVPTCVIVGAVAASASYWILESSNSPEVLGSLVKYKSSAVGATLLLTAGWGVGLFCSLPFWLAGRRK